MGSNLGVRSSSTRWVLLVDADVVFGPTGVADLLTELVEGGYDALQAGLESVAGPGYWGQALAHHHRTGRSRNWFGLVATVVDRDLMLGVGFDDSFKSGEDIELRWRMRDAGLRTAVSRRVLVEHRFAADDFDFALDQFLMDGTGLGRMIRKHGWRGARLALLPAAAAVRGSALSLAEASLGGCATTSPSVGITTRLWQGVCVMSAKSGAVVMGGLTVRHSALRSSLGLVVAKAAQTGAGFAFWVVAARATSDREVGLTMAAVSAVMICTQLAVLGAGSAVILSVGRGEPPARVLDAAFAIVGSPAPCSPSATLCCSRL